MAVQGVVIEAHLRVERQQVTAAGDDKRVDLDKAGIKLAKGAVYAAKETGKLLRRVLRQTENTGNAAHVVRLQAGGRVDAERQDLLGLRFRDLFDVHAAFTGGDHSHPAVAAIDQKREIQLVADIAPFLDIEALDLATLGPGLVGDQCLAEKLASDVADLVDRLHHLDAAGLAAAASVDLCLDHIDRTAKFGGG